MPSWTESDQSADLPDAGGASTVATAGLDAPREEALFADDTGALREDTRRALVHLLQGPSIDGRRHPKLWPVLVRDEKVIRARLHELFLDLVIDHDQRVAFTRQVASDRVDVPILLRKAKFTFLESALLLFLRQRLTQADAQGERAVVALDEMTEHMSVFERDSNPDHARFERLKANAVDKAKALSLLQSIGRNAKDRFEVSPTLKLLFSAEEIQDLTRTYTALAAGQGATSQSTGDDGPLGPDDCDAGNGAPLSDEEDSL
jgi:hypothetical protein